MKIIYCRQKLKKVKGKEKKRKGRIYKMIQSKIKIQDKYLNLLFNINSSDFQ